MQADHPKIQVGLFTAVNSNEAGSHQSDHANEKYIYLSSSSLNPGRAPGYVLNPII